MNSSPHVEYEDFARRHRGGMLLERHGLELYLHPFLGFTLAPGLWNGLLNTDEEGFRLSDSPFGAIDSASWLDAGGGGIMLGNSVTVALAASSDSTTPASFLAHLSGSRQLNLGLCAAVSVQEMVASVPFLHAASTVVIIGGAPDFINLASSLTPKNLFGTVSYERTFEDLKQIPLFDLAILGAGKTVQDLDAVRRPRRSPTAWDFAEVKARTAVAAQRRLRDLGVIARSVGDGTRILFCLQPVASTRTRAVTPEERQRYDFDTPVFGILHTAIEDNWNDYADLLAAGCADLGICFLNMSADLFVGDSFSDTVHLTDSGNRQAAQMIHEVLEAAPPVRSQRGETTRPAPVVKPVPAAPPVAPDPASVLRLSRADPPPVTARSEWLPQLTSIITTALDLEPGQLTRTGDFVNDYGADSIMVIDVLARIEQDMGIALPDTAVTEMSTLDAVLALVARHAGEADPDV